VHAVELKRLRQEDESLHAQKEQLRRHLVDADHERRDLQESFLYVKQQLDKLQMKQFSASANVPTDIAKETERIQQNTEAINEERKQLTAKLESFRSELEREKTYHQSSTERMMTANSQLLQKKDRMKKEVDRTTQLYATSVDQLQQMGERGDCTRGDSLACVGADPTPAQREEMSRLRAEIAEVDQELKKKGQVNDSLKSRIRKLAVT